MKTLEEEAKEYATNHGMMAYVFPEKMESFIDGANSKWVQAEKIKAQIKVLEKAWKANPPIDELIFELEQQLKELENGK